GHALFRVDGPIEAHSIATERDHDQQRGGNKRKGRPSRRPRGRRCPDRFRIEGQARDIGFQRLQGSDLARNVAVLGNPRTNPRGFRPIKLAIHESAEHREVWPFLNAHDRLSGKFSDMFSDMAASAERSSKSLWRARATRLMTVPLGIDNTSPVSL